MVPGPDGKLITGSEANHLHRIAVVCMPSPPECTVPAVSFHQRLHHSLHYFGASLHLAVKLDKTLEQLFPDPTDREGLIEYREVMKDYFPLIQELVITHSVDLYLQYVADLLRLIYVSRPETLRSARQVRIDEVLQFSTMDDLIRYLAGEEVNRLSFKGLLELSRGIDKELGLPVVANGDLERLARYVDLRNLFVHNGGVADAIFVAHNPAGVRLGERVSLQGTNEADADLLLAAFDLDQRAREKFGLPSATGPRLAMQCGRLGK